MSIKDDLIEELRNQISIENQESKNSPEISPVLNNKPENKPLEIKPVECKEKNEDEDEDFLEFYDPA
jgi:hypothetical protein